MARAAADEITVLAVFEPSSSLETLVGALRKTGVPPNAIEVISPLPLHEASFQRPVRIPLYVMTIIAGVVGIGVGVFFAAGTALLYPIVTGGKPIVAPPVVGIISFETMMLLAIVTTFVTMVVRLRPGHQRDVHRDPRVDDGAIAISVKLDRDDPRRGAIETLFKESGAREVRTASPPESSPLPLRGRTEAGGMSMLLNCGFALLVLSTTACSKDMEEQVSYQAQEAPRRHSPARSIPQDSRAIVPIPPAQPRARRDVPSSQALPAESAQPLEQGRRLFGINCAHCHGPTGDGDGPVAGYLRELPKNLHAPHVQNKSAADLYAIVTDGKDAMPSFKGELSADERWAVAQYVKSLSPAATAK